MEEQKIEKYLRKEVKKLAGEAFKFVSPAMRGVPDRLVLLPGGRIIFVELKAKYGKLSPMQKLRRKQLRALGCKVVTISSKDEVDKFIERMKENEK